MQMFCEGSSYIAAGWLVIVVGPSGIFSTPGAFFCLGLVRVRLSFNIGPLLPNPSVKQQINISRKLDKNSSNRIVQASLDRSIQSLSLHPNHWREPG